jgi:hypothetical protein
MSKFFLIILTFISFNFLIGEEIDPKKYEGYYRFVRDDFKKRHRFMLNFLVNKALNTRLCVKNGKFIQYISPKKTYKSKRKIISVKNINGSWHFERMEGNKKIMFSFIKEKNKWFYVENKLKYQVIKDNEKEHNDWVNNN